MSLVLYQYNSKWDDPTPHKIKKIEKAYLDGYQIAERLLEGCQFWFKVSECGNDIDVWVDDMSLSYMNRAKMNIEEWIKEAKVAILNHDVFRTEEYTGCGDDEDDVFLYNSKNPEWFDEQGFEIVS